jgi:hypothetical protein
MQEMEGSQEAPQPAEVKNPDVLIDFREEMQNLKKKHRNQSAIHPNCHRGRHVLE